ncbi:Uncharacterized conserved protein, DUF302 family [Tistlia consotensis]|uniref:Uncharacterized conserved protein, DUF302 family n=1 Tax=Tistlia consotensis USBA 355 TaxID=560819 RepID=A0A1Y6C9F9_9PROT|nr:DUF302 domain-containing protein [Tistlia consotensis]SMF44047.1 Uncharacterized conserved protein, DUF302 family [Tistlia consotensis USBA 355]SNR43045.1 Uncharacterized conserved protein, DUF302 family [Tistlia consotensis]
MSYYLAKTLDDASFDEVVERVTGALKEEGFGVLTDIDVQRTLKDKLGLEFRKYRILGACNPPLAHQALEAEDKIGTMLPCNVVVQEMLGGHVEVAAVDPAASMQAVKNPALEALAETVRGKLEKVMHRL